MGPGNDPAIRYLKGSLENDEGGRQVGLVKFGLPKLDKNILVKESMESDIYWNLSISFNLGSSKLPWKITQSLIGDTSSTGCFFIVIR